MSRPKLDVETDEERQQRLGSLFTSLTSNEATHVDQAQIQQPSKPFAVPESDALARARAFLPLLAQSNADIMARAEAGESVGIDGHLTKGKGKEEKDEESSSDSSDSEDSSDEEEGDGEDKKVVEMDVGLGVFDVKGEAKGDLGPVVERDASVWAEGKDKDE